MITEISTEHPMREIYYLYPESDFDAVAYPMRNIGLILSNISGEL